MGLWPSCVKTARRHAAVRLFVITEQVIYICIFSSAFDTPLDFFGRLLLKQTCAAWYATHTGSPSGHHQWRLKSDEEKERVKRGRKRKREGKNERENSLHSVPEKAQHFQKASMFGPQCFDLNYSSKANGSLVSHHTSHRLLSNFWHQSLTTT